MNIIVSGLTGAGKTTTTRELCARSGRTYVSGSDVRVRALGLPDPPPASSREFWLASGVVLNADAKRLRAGHTEEAVEHALMRRHERGDNQVFDVWFLAWLLRPPALRVWLEAPLELRVDRVRQQVPNPDRATVAAGIAAKDTRSRDYGLKQYGIDVAEDRRPFDIVVDMASDVPASSLASLLHAAATVAEGRQPPQLAADDVSWGARCFASVPEDVLQGLGITGD